jgi:tetratricopeptide (TPR) repeat protein
MKKLVLVCLLFAACQSSGSRLTITEEAEAVQENLSALTAAQLFEKGSAYLEAEKPQHAVDCFEFLVRNHPDDGRSIEAWLSLGKIYADQFHEYETAIRSFEKVIELYPDSAATSQAYFMLGFVYSNYLDKLDAGREFYRTFLAKYPDHELVPSVEFELEHLGKDADEILGGSGADSVQVQN